MEEEKKEKCKDRKKLRAEMLTDADVEMLLLSPTGHSVPELLTDDTVHCLDKQSEKVVVCDFCACACLTKGRAQ